MKSTFSGDKVTCTHLVKNFLIFPTPKGALRCLQEPTTVPVTHPSNACVYYVLALLDLSVNTPQLFGTLLH
jgi:hypothetical protein